MEELFILKTVKLLCRPDTLKLLGRIEHISCFLFLAISAILYNFLFWLTMSFQNEGNFMRDWLDKPRRREIKNIIFHFKFFPTVRIFFEISLLKYLKNALELIKANYTLALRRAVM